MTVAGTISGVILDVDGTLTMSNDAHAHAWVEAFASYGYDIQFDQVRPLIGMGGDQLIPQLVPELQGKEGVGKQIADRRKELIINKFGAGLSPTPGSRALIEKMKSEGLHLIVASSATEAEMDVLLKAAQVDDLLDEFVTSSDAEASKPEPDLVEAALSKAHLAADSTLMLGDSPYDVEAAAKAGVGVIAFRTGGFSYDQLAGAIAIYDDPADLLDSYNQSPLAVHK
jgi:HAD superfamily hydrolase (TIGR01509 family)